MSDLQLLLGRAGIRIGSVFNNGDLLTADDVAITFGLKSIGKSWKGVSKNKSFKILKALLEQDLAYNGEADTHPKAEEMATEFLEWFRDDVKYFTNASWTDENPFSSRSIGSWQPATQATFDSGIIVLGVQSGVYWIEDED